MAGVLVIAIAGSAPTPSGADKPRAFDSPSMSHRAEGRVGGARCSARKAVEFYARRIAEHRARMGLSVSPRGAGSQSSSSDAELGRHRLCPRYLAHVLQRKARAWRLRAERWFTRLYEKWRCIHEREGAWNANTGNGYYGGLQMTLWFQQTYGPEFVRRWGTANNWPVWAQLVAAERAYQDDGDYGQWGTAPACGLPT